MTEVERRRASSDQAIEESQRLREQLDRLVAQLDGFVQEVRLEVDRRAEGRADGGAETGKGDSSE